MILKFTNHELIIIVKDNGVGFDASQSSTNGIGLNNMKKRGALINAEISIESEENKGTLLTIIHRLI